MTVFPTTRDLENKIEDLRGELLRERESNKRLRMQLVAVAAVAQGWCRNGEMPLPGHPMWSPALHDVVRLRDNFDSLRSAEEPETPG